MKTFIKTFIMAFAIPVGLFVYVVFNGYTNDIAMLFISLALWFGVSRI